MTSDDTSAQNISTVNICVWSSMDNFSCLLFMSAWLDINLKLCYSVGGEQKSRRVDFAQVERGAVNPLRNFSRDVSGESTAEIGLTSCLCLHCLLCHSQMVCNKWRECLWRGCLKRFAQLLLSVLVNVASWTRAQGLLPKRALLQFPEGTLKDYGEGQKTEIMIWLKNIYIHVLS